ncbi:MAG: hypothetical protein RLZZ350_837, partial [Verrucomicrobiota bacterium]
MRTNGQLKFRACFVAVGLFAITTFADDAGFGPQISVPRDVEPAAPEKLPARNWVDQTRDEALKKSVGCLECHKGIENHSMHV